MARLPVWFVAVLTGLLVLGVLSIEPVFAQDPGGGGRRPGGGGGRPGGGRGGDRRREMEEQIKKEADAAAYAAAKKAIEAGKSEEEAKAAAEKAVDELIDKRVDEIVERMGQGGGGNNPGGGAPGGGMLDPEQIKKRIKERMGDTIKEAANAAADRAVEDYKTKSWKEIEPLEELVDEEKEESEIKEAIKETTLFEDFMHKEEKDLEELKLTKPVVILFYTGYDGKKSTEKKVEKCEEMQEKVLSDPDVVSAGEEYARFRCDITKLNGPLKRKYRAHSAPVVVFFDCTGKRLWSFTNPKQKAKTLVKKMEGFVEKSETAKEKAEEKKLEEEEEEEKETGKEEEKP